MRNLKYIYGIFVFILISVFCQKTFADALDSLNKLLNQYETLSGEFEQTLVDDQGQLIQDSQGQFLLKRPGYFRWDTQSPFPQLLVSNLETIWLYDPDLEQVTVRPYANNIDQTPSLLLSGDTEKIAERYQISQEDNLQKFTLIPKQETIGTEAATFTELKLEFEQGKLVAMIMRDTLAQTTTFRFIDVVANPTIEMSQFEFTPPPGVDVLGPNNS